MNNNVTPPPTPNGKRFLSDTQRQQVAALFDAIWPSGEDYPGSADAKAADYLDLLLGCNDSVYYELASWRSLYTGGLDKLNAAALDDLSLAKPLQQLTREQITGLLQALAAGGLSGLDAAWQRQFFSTVRGHAIEGCLADARWGGNKDNTVWNWLGYPNGQAKDFKR